MNIPTISFADLGQNEAVVNIKKKIREGESSAYDVVMAMTDDQCRYALLMALVLLFGAAESNAPDMVAENWPVYKPLQEGHVILAQAAMSRTRPEVVAELENRLTQTKDY